MDDAERRALIDEWFRQYADRVLAYLLHRTDAHTAQDVLQEVFVIAFRKAPSVPQPAVGWLIGTARRVLANRLRGLRRHDELVAKLAADAAQTKDPDLAALKQAFADTLDALPPADREVLTLSGWYDLTPQEAAEAVGCTPGAYAVRLHRARRRLDAHLSAAGHSGDSPAGRLAEALRD